MRALLPIVFACAVVVDGVTPVEKVIELLENLKSEVEQDGQNEATAYDEFACFCRDTTSTKSDAIKNGHDEIDTLSGNIELDSATKAEKERELKKRKADQEALAAELEETTTRCLKEALEFEAEIADLTKALTSLGKAITALKDSKPTFLQRDLVREVGNSVQLADALGLTSRSNAAAVESFLQAKVDPDDATYKFRSSGIISTLETLEGQFSTKKTETEEDRDAAKEVCDNTTAGLTTQMSTNNDAMVTLDQAIAGLRTSIAEDRDSLVQKEDTLKDDQLYLKDLTERCEARARDWDQRSAGRADELKALTEALAILKDGKDGQKSVQELDAVNNRSVLLQHQQIERPGSKFIAPLIGGERDVVLAATVAAAKSRSFLQLGSDSRRSLRGRSTSEVQRERVVGVLHAEGARLHSQLLATLSSNIAANPFGKVKQLIQQLIERLLKEAAQEATKKGFCDMEVGKAKLTRKERFADIIRLSSEVNQLDVKAKELDGSIATLNDTIPDLYQKLNETAMLREEEKATNLESIKLAKEGVQAVSEAITILKVHFKKAGRATVLLQASPVDDDTTGPGFQGAYRGKQNSAHNIIGLLEVIQSDFDRTARQTAQAEKEAQAEFVEFERTQKTDISAKEMTLELNTQEVEAVRNRIDKKMGDLTTAQNLLDDALKALEDLKPMCIDTGMTYAERVSKREEEIAALKKALCLIDPEGKEPECSR